jgi:hypothetical protein
MRRLLPWTAVAAAVTAVGGASWHIVALTRIFIGQLAYPVQAEGLEGLVMYTASRLLHHQTLYHAPGKGFIPQTHPPLHAAVLAGVGWIFGLDYTVARGVSVAFFAISCIAIGDVVRRQFRHRRWGIVFAIVAVGMAASSAPTVAFRYDLVHDDTMALGLSVLAGWLATSESLTWRRILCLGVILTAMGFTRVIDDNYFCRSATITSAGRCARPEGSSDPRIPMGSRWSPTSRSGC